MAVLQQLTLLWKLRTLVRHPVRSFKLFLDRETPLQSKLLPVFALIYTISPLDFLPDVFPILGQFDDVTILVLFIAYALSRIPNSVYERQGLDPKRSKIDYTKELP